MANKKPSSRGVAVDALLANAGRGLGHAFLDQDFENARRVIDTNITGTIYLSIGSATTWGTEIPEEF